MSYRIFAVVFLVLLGVGVAACAGTTPSGPAAAPAVEQPEEVQINLTEFRVETPKTEFQMGKPYRFVITNKGTIAHEWVIAPRGATDDGEFLTEVEEDDLPMGGKATHEYTFTEAGEFEMSCHVPGHYEAGMKIPITVK